MTMKRVLMIAFHFPPLAGSSGIQRTLRFARHLPEQGWEPLVLTATEGAYETTSADLLADVPQGLVVERALAFDTARHLSVAGRYWSAMARPDRWISWRFDAIRKARGLIHRYRPEVIWSTYPIATAHVIGASIHRSSGLPWVADFRDPMAQKGYPSDPLTWQKFDQIERTAITLSKRSVFVTRGAAREYARRYPEHAERLVVIENGYDEESFAQALDGAPVSGSLNPGCLTLLHSGIVYPSERDPKHLMNALRAMAANGEITPGTLRVRFRASAHDPLLRQMAVERGIEPFIEVLPAIGYRDALQEMMRADGLLVLQASNCNEQVPAKIYEYLRAGRPIIAFTDKAGDTAATLRDAGVTEMASLHCEEEIMSCLRALLSGATRSFMPRPEAAAAASRVERTKELARVLEQAAVG